jgi:hypothetical protein
MATDPFLLLMPSYNQAHYIVHAVRSVLAQDDPEWELWIVDNSTDATPQAMQAFDDPRIRFHHIPQRMDPGTCLNWMLARAQGTMFSYLHTDNDLQPNYVRAFRAAMSGRELALAYCDMRLIDGSGRCTGVHRRGRFDFPRLLSLDPLGVPFAATTELARRLGGFSANDVADDVRFCIASHGPAEFVHVPEPIIDYRAHVGSRTAGAGGTSGVRAVFLRLFAQMQPQLEARGLQPRHQLALELQRRLDDLEWLAEHQWYHTLARRLPQWWPGRFRIDRLFEAGLLRLPRLQRGRHAPSARALFGLRDGTGRRIGVMRSALAALLAASKARALRKQAEHAALVLLPWASLEADMPAGSALAFRIGSLDFRTIWAARELELGLGWRPTIDPSIRAPDWLVWGRASGHEPLLDAARLPRWTGSALETSARSSAAETEQLGV